MSQNVNLNQTVFLFVWIKFVIIVFTFNNFMSCKEINYAGLNYIQHVSGGVDTFRSDKIGMQICLECVYLCVILYFQKKIFTINLLTVEP